ncbi:hypothetical protein NDU88_003983, partial [Pleurodeles waltl]
PPTSGPARLQTLTRWRPGGARLIPAASPTELLQGRIDPAGRVSIRLPGATHDARTVSRPAQQGPVRLERNPGRPSSFNRRGVQQGTGGAGTNPALRSPPSARCEQVRPAAPGTGRNVAFSSSVIQWAPPPPDQGFSSACFRISPIQRAGSAAGSQVLRTPARISQVLSRGAQQGPAGTERSAQLTSPGGGNVSSAAATHPGVPVASVGRSSGGGPRGPGNPHAPSTAQCAVRSSKAHGPRQRPRRRLLVLGSFAGTVSTGSKILQCVFGAAAADARGNEAAPVELSADEHKELMRK